MQRALKWQRIYLFKQYSTELGVPELSEVQQDLLPNSNWNSLTFILLYFYLFGLCQRLYFCNTY